MVIQKNKYYVIFFIILAEIASLGLVALCFFSGFELTHKNLIIYILGNIFGALLGIIVYILYCLFCRIYYKFTNDSIKEIKNGNIAKVVNYNQIISCEYYCFIYLLIGDLNGGLLIIYYLENDEKQVLKLSCTEKKAKKLMIIIKRNIIIYK